MGAKRKLDYENCTVEELRAYIEREKRRIARKTMRDIRREWAEKRKGEA